MSKSVWEEQQKRAFLAWTNHYLALNNAKTYESLEALVEEDGILTLLEVVFQRKLFRRPAKSPFIRLENYNHALTLLGQPFGVVASNLVFNGDQKMALSFLWHIIQKYNIQKFVPDADKTPVFEFNAPAEPIKYWENDVETAAETVPPGAAVTLAQSLTDWLQEATTSKLALEDLLYFSGDTDTRLAKLGQLVLETIAPSEDTELRGLAAFCAETAEQLKRGAGDSLQLGEQFLRKYFRVQALVETYLGVPRFAVVFARPNAVALPLVGVAEQPMLAYLAAVRDALHRVALRTSGQADVPPPLPEDDFATASADNELRAGVETELGKSVASSHQLPDELSFEAFVALLEPELRPLAEKLRAAYETEIRTINEYLVEIKIQEERRRLRDQHRREQKRLELALAKESLLEEKTRALQKTQLEEGRCAYLRKLEELETRFRHKSSGREDSFDKHGRKPGGLRGRRVEYATETVVVESSKHRKPRDKANESRTDVEMESRKRRNKHREEQLSRVESESSKRKRNREDRYLDEKLARRERGREEAFAELELEHRNRARKKRTEFSEETTFTHREESSRTVRTGKRGVRFEELRLSENSFQMTGFCGRCSVDVVLHRNRDELSAVQLEKTRAHGLNTACPSCGHKVHVVLEEKPTLSKLRVVIHGAKNLVAKHFFGGTANPFAVINFMGELKKTKVKENTLAPAFNTKFEYDLGDHLVMENVLNVGIRDSNGNKYLGSKEFKMKEILGLTKQGSIPYKGLFELANGKGAVIGLSFEFI